MQNPYKTTRAEHGVVTHPAAEEWMAYLYGEVPRQRRISLDAHLETCRECRANVDLWQSTMSGLGQWQLESREAAVPVKVIPPAFRWALAALVILGLGCLIGRVSAPRPDLQAIRLALEGPLRASVAADVQQQVQEQLQADWQAVLNGDSINTPLRRELRAGLDQWAVQITAKAASDSQQLLTDFAETYRTDRQSDRQMMLTLVDRAEQKNQAEHLGLRRALETVAVVAADKFQSTETQLGELATYTQSRFALNASDTVFPSNNSSTPKGTN